MPVMNLKLIKSLLAAVIASTLFMTICSAKGNSNTIAATKGANATITSKEGDIQLTVGSDWIKDLKLNINAKLITGNPGKEQFVIVAGIPKSEMADGVTLDEYKQLFITSKELLTKNLKELETKDITIDGIPAKQVEFTAEVSNIKVHYLAFLLGKGNMFYQILTYSSESKFANNKKEFLKVGQSFKVLKEIISVPATVPNKELSPPTVLTSKDKTMEIRLPVGWKKVSLLNAAEVQIQASLITEDKWLVVISENKGNFVEDMTMKDYYDIVIEKYSNELENAKISETKKVEIGGLSAYQTEIQGEINKLKVAYLLTIVESPKQFTQIVFWTGQPKMNKSRDMFIKAVQTYKETR